MSGWELRTLEHIYQEYLTWFRERARPGCTPANIGQITGLNSINEDVFEDEDMVINRIYYHIPLSALFSHSGKLEVFSFSSLNLMEKCPNGEERELRLVLPLEYRREG